MSVRGISRRRSVAATSCAAAGIYISPAFGLAKAKPAKPANAYLMDLWRSSMRSCVRFPLNDVKIGPAFWGTRVAINRSACLPAVYEEERENGRLLNFERLHGTDPVFLSANLHSLRHGADSKIYKWVEGASRAMAMSATPNAARGLVSLETHWHGAATRNRPGSAGQHEVGPRGIRDPLVRFRC